MKEFDKIIGYEAIKQELEQISDVLANPEAYEKIGVVSPRGLLLHGDPGVGKTLMASAVIKASGRKAFICRKDKPNGDFIKAIKSTFAEAKASAPSIVFLDDMDKFANGDEHHPDTEEYVTVQSCIDEARDKEVFVLATANDLRSLPRSLLRPGRFDRILEVECPRGKDAEAIVAHYIGKKKFVGKIDAAVIARIMDGRSCAELETVINEAGVYAGFERSETLGMEHFMRACLHTVYDIPNEVLNEPLVKADLGDPKSLRARVIYHEAGHATVAEVLNPGSVTLISAFSRAGRSSGFTAYCRGGARSLESRYAQVCTSLAGMAALEQVYGITDTGTSRDLDQAFRSIWHLVTENCTSGFSLHSSYEDSQSLIARQEQAVTAEMERLYRKTKEILAQNRDLLDRLATLLAEKGVLTAMDIAVVKGYIASRREKRKTEVASDPDDRVA